MKKKILLSPLIIIILIIVLGVGVAGAAILISGSGGTEEVNLQKGLVGHWKLDGNAKDSTPYGNNGTVTGATLTTDRKGQANKAYSFDGTNDYISVASASNLNPTSAFTLEAWVKKSATKAQDIIFNDVHELKLDSSNKAVLRLMTGARLGTDMDMETAGVANWGAFSSPTTIAKNTTNPIQGSQDLRVVGDSVNDGVYQTIGAPGNTYRVKVSYRVVSGTLDISYDASTVSKNVASGLTGSGTVIAYVTPTGAFSNVELTTPGVGEFFVDDIEVKQVGATLTSSGTASANFDHIVATYDGSVSKIYINGVLDNSLTQAVTLSTDNLATLIGAGATGGTGYEQDFFNGSIDDVRIYNRALSSAEISALYQEYDPSVQISDLQKGLVGNWKMNGNAKDSTPYANNGTVSGATLTTDRKGQLSKAYSFNGTSDYIDAGTGASLNITGDLTIALWLKKDGTAYPFFIAKDISGGNTQYQFYGRPDSGDQLLHFLSGTTIVDGTVNVSNNVWHHVAVTRSGTTISFYVDGVFDVSRTLATPASSATNLNIGRDSDTSHTYSNGTLDDVRIYNRALSSAEISALYQEYDPSVQISDLQKGLVGHWKLDGNAKDSTPYANNGTVSGATLTIDRKGQVNKAYNFNGTSDYISVADSASLDIANAITIEAWVKSTVASGSLTKLDRIVEKNNSYAFDFNHDAWGKANFGFRYGAGGGDWANLQYLTTLPANTWMHLVATYDGQNIRVYLNGVQDNSVAETRAIALSNNSAYIGTYGTTPTGTYNFSGLIDDVRIYNRALSAAEVLSLYQSY